jgi:hypothetical protein
MSRSEKSPRNAGVFLVLVVAIFWLLLVFLFVFF